MMTDRLNKRLSTIVAEYGATDKNYDAPWEGVEGLRRGTDGELVQTVKGLDAKAEKAEIKADVAAEKVFDKADANAESVAEEETQTLADEKQARSDAKEARAEAREEKADAKVEAEAEKEKAVPPVSTNPEVAKLIEQFKAGRGRGKNK